MCALLQVLARAARAAKFEAEEQKKPKNTKTRGVSAEAPAASAQAHPAATIDEDEAESDDTKWAEMVYAANQLHRAALIEQDSRWKAAPARCDGSPPHGAGPTCTAAKGPAPIESGTHPL